MSIEITSRESTGVQRHIRVSVPVEQVRDAEERAARRYASSARLPGFRPGKAPASMVRKKFAEAIRQDALEALVQEAYKEVIEREKLELASQPHVHDLQFEPNQPLTFELHCEVKPELSLDNISGFTVTRPPTAVQDEMVDEQLEHLRDQRATWTPTEDRPMPGDMVTVVLATAEDNGDMSEGREYKIVLGGGQAIPGIEELIMETAPGQTTERPVKWPDDFPDESQRGKTKPAKVELKDVKRKTMPELDDAFAREVGDFDSLEALRTAIRTDLLDNLQRESDAGVRQQLIDQIIGANSFDVPESWVKQLVDAYGNAYQIPEEERERFAGELRPMAERQVRRDLVIDTIAEREKLAATESDLDAKVTELAAARNADPGQVYSSLQKAGRLRELERGITEDRVFAWLMERNTVV
jgi:trigger factor